MIIAIHQPNFFPWMGYFDKIARADVFVFLDGVDFPKNSWVNRVRIAVQGEGRWLTCPVQRAGLATPISEIRVDDTRDWRRRMLKTLQANYARAAHFEPLMAEVSAMIAPPEDRLAEINMAAIRKVSAALGLATRFEQQTRLAVSGRSNDLLASIVQACGGDTYLMGGGAGGYHDEAPFAAAGIRVMQQAFQAAPYGPEGGFLPGLSVLDYLMHDGRPLTPRGADQVTVR